MILAMINGALYRDPEARTSKSGGEFVAATVKHLDGGRTQFVRVVAFDAEPRADLAGLGKGDALTVTGRLEAEVYEKAGEPPRVSMSIVADRVVSLRRQDAGQKGKRK